jgi:hypothetical protein
VPPLMSDTAHQRETPRDSRLARLVTYLGVIVAVSLAILLALDILDRGETIAGDIVFWVWFISTVALLVSGLGLLISRAAVRLAALATVVALVSFGVWALVTVVIL